MLLCFKMWVGEYVIASMRMATQTIWIFLILGITGCSEVGPVAPYSAPVTDPAQLYMGLTLDYGALTLSTEPGYNIWRLTATPRNALGEPMMGLPAPIYRTEKAGDTNTVHVTAQGTLTARAPGVVRIIAELIAPGNIRHADTTLVNVTTLASPPELASVSVNLPPTSAVQPINPVISGKQPGSGFLAAFAGFLQSLILRPLGLNTTGETIAGIPFEVQSLDPAIAAVIPATNLQTARITTVQPGEARIVARTTAYGITMADTVVITVTMPAYGDIVVRSGHNTVAIFQPNEVRIRPDGTIFWFNTLNQAVDVTFDDPTNVIEAPAQVCSALLFLGAQFGPGPHCGVSGNFTFEANPPDSTGARTFKVRRFSVPGVYTYRSTLTGATGRVVVSNEGFAP